MLKISTSVSVASAWCRAKNVSPLEVMGDRSFSPGSTWWVEPCLTALAVKRYRPGLRRPDGRLRGGGALRVQLQLDRQGQAVRALRPPSSANIHRFHASRSDLPVPHPSS